MYFNDKEKNLGRGQTIIDVANQFFKKYFETHQSSRLKGERDIIVNKINACNSPAHAASLIWHLSLEIQKAYANQFNSVVSAVKPSVFASVLKEIM